MARRDAEARELRARNRNLDVTGRIALVAALAARLQQPVLLQLARQLGRDRRPLAELAEVQLIVGVRQADCAASAPFLARAGWRGELLSDHAQRQEFVALQAQNRLQPLDVVLAEEPVAALRPPRGEQALVLQVANLRDRDVGELGLQTAADRPDREQPRALGCRFGGAHFSRKPSLYLPIWSSSPFSSRPDSMRLRLRKVPFRLPWSSMKNAPSFWTSTACLRETVTSSRKTSQSGERPMVMRSPDGTKCSPERPPPERMTSAGPSAPRSSSVSAPPPRPPWAGRLSSSPTRAP